MYHLIIEAFVIHVLNKSKPRPISKIVKIWFKTDSKGETTIRAVVIAMMDVIVIVVPVLNAPKSALFVDSCFFRSRVVSRMSVSTE